MDKIAVGKLIVMIQALLVFSSNLSDIDIDDIIDTFQEVEERKKREGEYNQSTYKTYYKELEELVKREGSDISLSSIMDIGNTLEKYNKYNE